MPCWQCPWSVGSPFSSCSACGDGSEQKVNREVNKGWARQKKMGPVPLVQVCKHQHSSCFVDVVASHVRLDTETLHPFLVSHNQARVWLRVLHWNQNSHHVYRFQSLHYVICKQKYYIVSQNLKSWNLILVNNQSSFADSGCGCCCLIAPSVSKSLLFPHSIAVFPLNVGYSSIFTAFATLVVLLCSAIFPHNEAVICHLFSSFYHSQVCF